MSPKSWARRCPTQSFSRPTPMSFWSGCSPPSRAAKDAVRILTSDGEFHSARRQFARWEESGEAVIDRIDAEPFETFSERFLERGPERRA